MTASRICSNDWFAAGAAIGLLSGFGWPIVAASAEEPDTTAVFQGEPAAHALYRQMVEAMRKADSLSYVSHYKWEARGRVQGDCTYRVPDLSELGQSQPPAVQVLPDSPAEKAGVRSGDRITALNGRTVKRIEDVLILWGELKLDDGLGVKFLREGKQGEVRVPADVLECLLEGSSQDSPRP